ncbi:MAG: cation diffusion facilitator family transporter [Bacillota bacterium]|nr:cation diffusion facilitator family transporter [Bacillota bacterium]
MENREKTVKKITVVTITLNISLAIIKVAAGIISNSSAIIADGIHSLSDVVSTVIAYIGIKISVKEEDENHPYGHEKFEPVLSKILAIVLFITAFGIMAKGYNNFRCKEIEIISNMAIYAAVISIVVKEWMYHYTIKASKQIKSSILKADAWHHRSDALSSIGAFIGIFGAQMGYPILEPIATIVIGVLIAKVAASIYMQSIRELTDTAADSETICEIEKFVLSVAGIEEIDLLKTRTHGNRLYVDLEISVDGNLSLFQSHAIAEKAHDLLEKELPIIKHCMVHVNPMQKE